MLLPPISRNQCQQKRVDYLKTRENNLLPEFIKNNDDPRSAFSILVVMALFARSSLSEF
jgi:hypothetical protein